MLRTTNLEEEQDQVNESEAGDRPVDGTEDYQLMNGDIDDPTPTRQHDGSECSQELETVSPKVCRKTVPHQTVGSW